MLGNGAPEEFELSANGRRLRLFRNAASVVLDIAGVERIELESRGGSDMITLSSLWERNSNISRSTWRRSTTRILPTTCRTHFSFLANTG